MYVIVNVQDGTLFRMLFNNVVYTDFSISKASVFNNLDLAKKQCEVCNELGDDNFVVKQIVLEDPKQ